MGGQACVFYGAAEFSRDLDLLVVADPRGFALLRAALDDLEAERIEVPSFEPEFLRRGHAVHFRCAREDVKGLRIDLMSKLRGVDDFESLWLRRSTVEADGVVVEMMALEDLVLAKKTQRDKDWPMIRRLVEESYFQKICGPAFWLRELRTPELIIEAAAAHRDLAREMTRPAVAVALTGDPETVAAALTAEENSERARDRLWWQPLRAELEQLRHAKTKHRRSPARYCRLAMDFSSACAAGYCGSPGGISCSNVRASANFCRCT